jgi:hypothetical protein
MEMKDRVRESLLQVAAMAIDKFMEVDGKELVYQSFMLNKHCYRVTVAPLPFSDDSFLCPDDDA